MKLCCETYPFLRSLVAQMQSSGFPVHSYVRTHTVKEVHVTLYLTAPAKPEITNIWLSRYNCPEDIIMVKVFLKGA